jgi:hypothetical protein
VDIRDYRKEAEALGRRSIIEVASVLGLNIVKKGKDHLISCPSPSHEDKNPSCILFEDGGLWCRSCHYKANAYKLIYLITGDSNVCDWAVANGLIYEHFKDGSKRKGKYIEAQKTKIIKEEKKAYKPNVEHHEIYDFFLTLLEDIDKGHYLSKERLLSLDVLKENKIKAINEDYKEALLNKFSESDLLKSGLLARSSEKNNIYFTFFNCNAVFPFYKGNKIISLQGRAKSGAYKYINLSGSLRAGVYVPKISNNKDIYFCEGIITALSYASKGHDTACMIGTHIADNESLIIEPLNSLKNRTFILSPDYDEPGEKAIKKIKRTFNKNNIQYEKEYHGFRDLARLTGAKESKICSLIDYNDFLMFMEKKNGNR